MSPADDSDSGDVTLTATVPVEAGNVIVTSAVLAGPINVALLVPLFVPSKNSILPPVVAVGVNTGSVNVLFVSVCVAVFVVAVSLFTVSPVVIATLAGKPIVNVPEFSPTVTSLAVPWNETVSPSDAAVELPPTLAKVILLLANELFAIFVNVLSGPVIVLFVSVCVAVNVAIVSVLMLPPDELIVKRSVPPPV